MTQPATSTPETAEPFWTRVRAAIAALRPANEADVAGPTGNRTRLGARIGDELLQGWNHAAARHVSLSLLVIEIDRFAEYVTAYGRGEADGCVLAVMEAITDVLPRGGDACLRLGAAGFVVVLSDLPALMARATAGKIAEAVRKLGLPHKESHAGVVTLSTGLAVTNPQGAYDPRFFEIAAETLNKASRKGMGRLEMLDLRPTQERRRRAA